MGHSVSLVHKENRNHKLRNWAQIRPHWYLNMFQTRFLDNQRQKHYQQFFNEADYNMKILRTRWVSLTKANYTLLHINKVESNNCFNPRTYTQIHTPTVVQAGGGWNSYPEFLICCSILKRFYLQWKAFDLLNKMRYILGVVTLLEASDVTNNGRHLDRHLDFTKNQKSA